MTVTALIAAGTRLLRSRELKCDSLYLIYCCLLIVFRVFLKWYYIISSHLIVLFFFYVLVAENKSSGE